jgi:hypothetical protein
MYLNLKLSKYKGEQKIKAIIIKEVEFTINFQEKL